MRFWTRFAVSFAVALSLCGCERASTASTEVIRTVRGDTDVVVNVGSGAWEHCVVPREELRIGQRDGVDEYTFGSIRAFAVSPFGAMYVYDGKFRSLRMYDTSGRFVRTIGREGSGPGEHREILGLAAFGTSLVAWEGSSRRLLRFTTEGAYMATHTIASGSVVFAANALVADTTGMVYIRVSDGLLRVDRDGRTRGVLSPPPSRLVPRVGFLLPAQHWTLLPSGDLAWGESDEYAVFLSRSGAKLRRVERRIQPDRIAPSERAEYQALTDWMTKNRPRMMGANPPPVPAERPFFSAIQIDPVGHLWILRQVGSRKVESQDRARFPDQPAVTWSANDVYDVFRFDGVYLGEVPIPPSVAILAIRGDLAWGTFTDDMGVEFITRYRLTSTPCRDSVRG